jgi:hypothetical protein
LSHFIELEIQKLITEFSDLDDVAERLIQTIESSPSLFNEENIKSVAQFLFNTGKNQKLIQFVLRHVGEKKFLVPWPFFLEALGRSQIQLGDVEIKSIFEGIQKTKAQAEASRSKSFDSYIPIFGEWRSHRKYKIQKDYLGKKSALIDKLFTLRTEQLIDEEKKVLKRLQFLFPGDKDVAHEMSEHKQRYALNILARHSPKPRTLESTHTTVPDLESELALNLLSAELLTIAKMDPRMAFEFAVAAFMLEAYDLALDVLQFSEQTEPAIWLRLELLLNCRRFAELLSELAQVEILLAGNPETFFASTYLRAQALWGLKQKHSAIELLHGVVNLRPNYRAASTLLSVWSDHK